MTTSAKLVLVLFAISLSCAVYAWVTWANGGLTVWWAMVASYWTVLTIKNLVDFKGVRK